VTPLLIIGTKYGTRRLLQNIKMFTTMFREKIIPSTIGLAAIPVVVPPVDNTITYGINSDLNNNDNHIIGVVFILI